MENQKEKKGIIVPKKMRPLFTGVLLTMNVIEVPGTEESVLDPETGLYTPKLILGDEVRALTKRGESKVSNYQRVVAVGKAVRDVEVGDMVRLNLDNFAERKFVSNGIRDKVDGMTNEIVGYRIPYIEIAGEKFISCDERDIEMVVTEYDVE